MGMDTIKEGCMGGGGSENQGSGNPGISTKARTFTGPACITGVDPAVVGSWGWEGRVLSAQ